jgi:hypothetical protein
MTHTVLFASKHGDAMQWLNMILITPTLGSHVTSANTGHRTAKECAVAYNSICPCMPHITYVSLLQWETMVPTDLWLLCDCYLWFNTRSENVQPERTIYGQQLIVQQCQWSEVMWRGLSVLGGESRGSATQCQRPIDDLWLMRVAEKYAIKLHRSHLWPVVHLCTCSWRWVVVAVARLFSTPGAWLRSQEQVIYCVQRVRSITG